jgi:hypothetical protein
MDMMEKNKTTTMEPKKTDTNDKKEFQLVLEVMGKEKDKSYSGN